MLLDLFTLASPNIPRIAPKFFNAFEAIIKPLNAAEQQFSAFTPFGIFAPTVPVSAVFFQPFEFIPRPRLITPDFPPLISQISFIVTGWRSEEPVIRIKGINVTLHDFTNIDQPFVAISTSGPVFAQSPDIFVLHFNAATQQFQTFEPLGNVPTAPTPYGWMEQQPNAEIFIKALNVAQQQFGAFEPLGFIQPPPVSAKKPSWLIIARRRGKR